jgi:hypothetical protein
MYSWLHRDDGFECRAHAAPVETISKLKTQGNIELYIVLTGDIDEAGHVELKRW